MEVGKRMGLVEKGWNNPRLGLLIWPRCFPPGWASGIRRASPAGHFGSLCLFPGQPDPPWTSLAQPWAQGLRSTLPHADLEPPGTERKGSWELYWPSVWSVTPPCPDPFLRTRRLALTMMGWRLPSCQVMDIWREAWWKFGSVAITFSSVTSLVVGGGSRIVQGALGTQEYQSSYKGQISKLTVC